MTTAALRAYRDGPDTTLARHRIVTTYLNAEPLGSRPGYGEITGVPEAMWRWYGTDVTEADQVLTRAGHDQGPTCRARERSIGEVLSLLLAGRRPAYYLNADPAALAALTDRYLPLLSASGIIDPALRDAALNARLDFPAEHTSAGGAVLCRRQGHRPAA